MLYRTLRVLCWVLYKVFYFLQPIGVENVPSQGAVILCSNHISVLDPPTIGVSLKRRIHFMAKEELFRIPLFNRLIIALGAFPVKRGGISKQSIRQTLQLLEEGHMIGIFPEGTRKSTGIGKRGAANFALKSNATVIPVAIIGNYRLFRKMKIVYGEPIDLSQFRGESTSDQIQQVTDKIMEAIYGLLEQHRS